MRRWRIDGAARRFLVAAALALLFGAADGIRAEPPSAAPRSFSAAGLGRVSDYIRNEVATGKVPGAILLIQQHRKPVYFENFGVRDVATEFSMSGASLNRCPMIARSVRASRSAIRCRCGNRNPAVPEW